MSTSQQGPDEQLLVSGSHLGFKLLEFLFPLRPIESISLDDGERRLSVVEPLLEIFHVAVERAPRRQRLLHLTGTMTAQATWKHTKMYTGEQCFIPAATGAFVSR